MNFWIVIQNDHHWLFYFYDSNEVQGDSEIRGALQMVI